MGEVGHQVLFVGFGVESQLLSPMVVERWYPEHAMCARLGFDDGEISGSVVLTTQMSVLSNIWAEAMGDGSPISEEEAYDLLGEMGNQLIGGVKTYLTDFMPHLRIQISTPEWLTDGRVWVASKADPPVPVLVVRLRHSSGDIHIGFSLNLLGEAFRHDTPLSWCFPPDGEAAPSQGAA